MLNNLPLMAGDPLWALIGQFNQDNRKNKVDLIVGVYRDETGTTPVMQVVQDAEQELAKQAKSKCYGGLSGNLKFNDQVARFLLGSDEKLNRQCTIQTVGGTGALRLLADFIFHLSPNSVIWNTDPGYINHKPIMESAGLTTKPFRWQQKEGALDIQACLADLECAGKGDILLLHGCCHNPTGIDPTLEQWQLFADVCKEKGVVPLVDIAYQGFAGTPETDAAGLRLFVKQLDLVLIATSSSKNMGLYCERTGAATIVTPNAEKLQGIRTLLESITRANYSMPPEHGAAIANRVFDNPEPWLDELSVYRKRIRNTRKKLGTILNDLNAPSELQRISQQNGMFSLLPLTKEQMSVLREKHAIYGVPNGRINVAGLKQSQIKPLAEALVSVMDQ